MDSRYPPGPDGGDLGLANLIRYQIRGLDFLAELAATYGDLVYLQLGGTPIYLLNHPDLVKQVMLDDWQRFGKPELIKASNRGHWGDGLTTLEGGTWRARRRLMQPAFHERRIAAFAPVIVACAQEALQAWPPGQAIHLGPAMLTLTARIAARVLFDAELEGFGSDGANRDRAGLIPLAEALGEDFSLSQRGDGPTSLVLTRRRAGPDMAATLRIIEARYASPEDRGDMLSFLLQATFEDGSRLSLEELTNELLQMFFAGHHTIPMTLVRLWYALGENPEVEATVHAELDEGLAGQPPDLAALARLPYGELVIKETMRRYPVAPLLSRQAAAPVELGGYRLREGALVWISPYLLHRDPRFFEQPERFWPERFGPSRAGQIPKYGYLPFGAGPRICIGNALAMMILRLVLATIAQTRHLRLAPAFSGAHPETDIYVQAIPRDLRDRTGQAVGIKE